MKIAQTKDGRWEFDSGEIGGTRIRKIFETLQQAEALLRKAKDDRKREGERHLMEWLSLNAGEAREILAYRREVVALKGRPDWRKGHELHVAHLAATQKGGLLTVLLAEYIARKRKAGRNSDYLIRLERELEAFVIQHPKLTAADITDRHIDAFLDRRGLEQITRANRVRDLRGLFSFAKKRNLCTVNPADMTEPIKIVRKRNKAFRLQEIAVILYVADLHPEWEMVPYVGFNLWGSSRVSESFRLDWSAYVPSESALIFSAADTKPNQERVTENLPPVLLDWIRPYIKTAGEITPPESTVEWRRANYLVPAIRKILPGFQWLRNGLRKTSISADYAVTKDAKSTAAKHGTSPEMLFRNYRMVMRSAEAAEYFQLTRANIAKYLKGLVPEEDIISWQRRNL